MNNGKPTGWRKAPARITLLAAFVAALAAAPAYAHGQHDLEVELFRGPYGPYELWITAVPLVGFLEVAVTFEPDNPQAQLPYNPRVLVSAERDGERLGPAAAAPAFLVGANDYSTTFAPPSPGEWRVHININSQRGPASLTLPVDVVAGRGFPWTALLAALGLLLPIAWLIAGALRRKSRPQRGKP